MTRRSRHHALSLLEVVLALAILAGACATLAQLVGLGMRAAGNGRDLAEGQLLADSVMTEIVTGMLPAQPLDRVPHDMYPGWVVSVGFEPTVHQGIICASVLVEQQSTSVRRARYQMSRWIRDPSLPLPVDETATAGATTTTSSSASGSATGSSAGGGR